jgi:hypothetical protein
MNALAPINDKLAALAAAEATLIDNDDTADTRRRDWRPGPEFVCP